MLFFGPRLAAATAALGILSPVAQAQTNFDQIESRFEEPRQALSRPGRVLPEFDPLSAPPAAADITFMLQGVQLTGNTVFSDEAISESYGGLVDQEVSVAQVFEIANRITTFYGQNGYPLTRAIIPAQEIDGGVIEVRIVEGFVSEVTIDGPGSENRLIQGHADKIRSEKPISNATLERNLLLADDLPGVTVQSVLRRSEDQVGGTDVFLQTTDDNPYEFRFTIDNRGNSGGPLFNENGQVVGVRHY